MHIEKDELDNINKVYISTGTTLLDCVLGGGWAGNRVINLIGDKGTSKTGLAIELAANFNKMFPNGKILYHETEAAFDIFYAKKLGLPESVIFVSEEDSLISSLKNDVNTVEGVIELIQAIISSDAQNPEPTLYILDSLDFLSDMGEMNREVGEGSYGTKAKMLTQFFRTNTKNMALKKITFFIISQVRDNLTGFGTKFTRCGGKALDHVCSQIVWLSEVSKIKKVSSGIEKVIGVNIKAYCSKNKVGRPFRDCIFPFIFEYGSNDLLGNLEWLEVVKQLESIQKLIGTEYKKIGSIVEAVRQNKDKKKIISDFVVQKWNEIEEAFTPLEAKYS